MMAELKREIIKYLRDYLKKDYIGQGNCFICEKKENLELHHLYGLSELFNTWCEQNSIDKITTVKEINRLRILFAEDEKEKLSNKYLYTLCKPHHTRLHTLYGQRYENRQVPKILRWIGIQKDKYGNT